MLLNDDFRKFNQLIVHLFSFAHLSSASPSISVDSNQNVIAMAKGTFGSAGGTLHCEDTGVTIIIPEGAIPVGVEQEIYFKVCYDSDMLPPLDRDKETLTSPIVMCGPHGIKFNLPVELRLPHSPTVNPATSSFSLKLSDTPNGKFQSTQSNKLRSINLLFFFLILR